jgi:hypothetical protein
MEGYDDESGSRRAFLDDPFEETGKIFEFLVDFDSDGLEDLGGGMSFSPLGAPVADVLNDPEKLLRGLYFFALSPFYDFVSQFFGLAKFPKFPEYFGQMVF